MPSTSRHRRWHITGFEPFLDHRTNPSAQVARALGARLNEARESAQVEVLPVTYERARSFAREHSILSDVVVLHLGLASRRSHLSLEQLAHNRHGDVLDNSGELYGADPLRRLDPHGPPQRASALDLVALQSALIGLEANGLPEARVTHDAGQYVCNAIYYHTLERTPCAAFLHVPWLSDRQADALGRALGEALLRAHNHVIP